MAGWELARFWPLAARAMRRRCPNCGTGRVWRSWLEGVSTCPDCALRLDRGEPDYFIGAYMVNLIVAETIVAGIFVLALVLTWPTPPWDLLTYGALALAVMAPLASYPYTRGLWLAVDLTFRPAGEERGDRS